MQRVFFNKKYCPLNKIMQNYTRIHLSFPNIESTYDGGYFDEEGIKDRHALV